MTKHLNLRKKLPVEIVRDIFLNQVLKCKSPDFRNDDILWYLSLVYLSKYLTYSLVGSFMWPNILSRLITKLFAISVDSVNKVNITAVLTNVAIIANIDRWLAQSPLKLGLSHDKYTLLALDQMDTQDESQRFRNGSIWRANPNCVCILRQGSLLKY